MLNSLATPPVLAALAELHETSPADAYDLYFCLPPVFEELRGTGVRIVPLIPSLHARLVFDAFSREESVETFRYMTYGPFNAYQDWLVFLEKRHLDPGAVQFCIFNTAGPTSELAGVVAYIRGDRSNLVIEVGSVRILPKHQRTHVVSQAVYLLVDYAFTELGVRRVQWGANALNLRSVATAKRLGFRYEGERRWERVLQPHKAPYAVVVPPDSVLGTPEAGMGLHAAMLAIGWDEWRDGVGEQMKALADRPPVYRP